jgi:hypothetical protein
MLGFEIAQPAALDPRVFNRHLSSTDWQWCPACGCLLGSHIKHWHKYGHGLGATVTVTPQLATLASAIQTQEGYYPGSVAFTNNNPGNLVFAGQPGATAGANGFAVFDSYQDGLNALYNQLNLYATGACGACGGQPLTISQMANIYAPAGQGSNDPSLYATNMAAALGVSPDTLLSSALSGSGSGSPATTGDDDSIDIAGLSLTQPELYIGAAVVLGILWLVTR